MNTPLVAKTSLLPGGVYLVYVVMNIRSTVLNRYLASKSSNLNLCSLFVCTNRKLNVIALLASQSECIDNTSLVAGGSASSGGVY